MSDEKLDAICTTLSRIETKLDTAADNFDLHVRDDALLAHEVRLLSKQRGFIRTGFAAASVGLVAAVDYIVKRTVGH